MTFYHSTCHILVGYFVFLQFYKFFKNIINWNCLLKLKIIIRIKDLKPLRPWTFFFYPTQSLLTWSAEWFVHELLLAKAQPPLWRLAIFCAKHFFTDAHTCLLAQLGKILSHEICNIWRCAVRSLTILIIIIYLKCFIITSFTGCGRLCIHRIEGEASLSRQIKSGYS